MSGRLAVGASFRRALFDRIATCISVCTNYRLTKYGSIAILAAARSPAETRRRSLTEALLETTRKQLLVAFAVDCVLDVGANEGQFALALRRSGYRGLIVSFEPVAASYRVLSQRAEGDPLWLVRPIALGADDGLATMRVFRATDFSSLLKPSDLGQSLFGGILREGHDEVVQVRRLDTILPEVIGARGVSRILLKMDTQGYDLEVFRGVGSWRSRVVALQSEVSMVPIYSGMPVLSESLSVYREAGYSIAGLFTVTQDLVSGEAIEADLLMIDPSAATTPGGEPA